MTVTQGPPIYRDHDWLGAKRLPARCDLSWLFYIRVWPEFTYLHCHPDITIKRYTPAVAQDVYQAMIRKHPDRPVSLVASSWGGTAYLSSVRMPDPMPFKRQPEWRPWG